MDLTSIYVLVGDLTSDTSHDRYSTAQIDQELDNAMDRWNVEAKIIKSSTTITTVDATRQYALSNISGTIIDIRRVTHKGLELGKKEKSWLDLYSGSDWTADSGTPRYFFLEEADPSAQYITVYPTPSANDAGANLVVEAIIRHTSMTAGTDVPFMNGSYSNSILRPYDWGLCYEVSARLLLRDPSPPNVQRTDSYAKTAAGVFANVVQVFKNLEREGPMKVRTTRRPIRGVYA